MTVKELIHKLSSLPSEMQDLEITVYDEGFERDVYLETAEDMFKPIAVNLGKEVQAAYNEARRKLMTPNRVIL